MEIRKADAKGRVTGFIPGGVYFVSREGGGKVVVALAPLSIRQTVEELREGKGERQPDEDELGA